MIQTKRGISRAFHIGRNVAQTAGMVRKVYVEVLARFSAGGGIRPEEIVWEDRRRFCIGRVLSAERAPARADAALPVRYVCLIGQQKKQIFFEPERMRWFVEV